MHRCRDQADPEQKSTNASDGDRALVVHGESKCQVVSIAPELADPLDMSNAVDGRDNRIEAAQGHLVWEFTLRIATDEDRRADHANLPESVERRRAELGDPFEVPLERESRDEVVEIARADVPGSAPAVAPVK